MPRIPAAVCAALVVALSLLTPTSSAAPGPGGRTCTITGTPGDDRLVGTPGRDVICGLGGDDVLVGRGGDDVLVGGGGGDGLFAGEGDDLLIGGTSTDRLFGHAGRDRIRGGPGNDTVDGGPGRDELDGGPDYNTCIPDRADRSRRCAYDEERPVVRRVVFAGSGVDVTTGPATLTVRVRASDDDRVQSVAVGARDANWYPRTDLRLVSDTRRSGWWEGTLSFPRYSPPGSYVPVVAVRDRKGRAVQRTQRDQVLVVRNDDPDVEQPRASLLAPTPGTVVDTRTRSREVTIRARVTDDRSGVEHVSISAFEPMRHNGSLSGAHGTARLVSGTRLDGVWQATVLLEKGVLGGEWTVVVRVQDRAHMPTYEHVAYAGPGQAHPPGGGSPGVRPLPDGMGSFQVLGRTQTDFEHPTVTGTTVTPAVVDTRSGTAAVTVSLQARDNVAVEHVSVWLRTPEAGVSDATVASAELRLVRGNRLDGTWSTTLTVPRGTPPGRYLLWVTAYDPDLNDQQWVGPSHPGTWGPRLDTDPAVTVVGG